MQITLYADILFAWNYLMDFVILFFTVQLTRNIPHPVRLSVSAALLALYGTCVFTPVLRFAYSLLGKLLISYLSVWLLRLSGGRRGVWKGYLVFWAISVGCGGVILALSAVGQSRGLLRAVVVNGCVYLPIPLSLLVTGILLSYGLMFAFRRVCIRNFGRDRILLPFVLYMGKEKIRFTALLDTGCECTVPLSGEGVLLLSRSALRGVTPPDELTLSIRTVEGGGEVAAFYPQRLECLSTRYKLVENPAIAVVPRRFAADDLYQGVFHPKIVCETAIDGTKSHVKEKMFHHGRR